MKALINGKVILEDSIVEEKVLIFDDKIKDIKDDYNLDYSIFDEVIDANGAFVSPGFIDVHIHGNGGSDTMDGTIDALKTISSSIAKNGVTSFLPTTCTMSNEKIQIVLNTIRLAMKDKMPGATVLGAHLEGPFINKSYKGAQNEKYILLPDFKLIQNHLDVVKIVSYAPEKDNNFEFAKKVTENSDIILSIGHTMASYETAIEAIKEGISHVTHTFNAMTPLKHREPGVVGAAFTTDVNCEIIADMIHIHPSLFQFIINVKGIDHTLLITDSMKAGNIEKGSYDLGGLKVIVDDNSARLENGTLAGSILKMNNAIKNIFNNTNLSLPEVIKMASLNQARELKLDEYIGSISKGKNADITIFNDSFEVNKTFVNGKIVYGR
ncbi:N-acetylglucosamine-6-phosphate deacetylase [Clostridium sediminicola]|uniref:N-acetylglucosamine-6-phosphate deacetylase n=1 Tax=Clostridium sediminicola TaxID=3114879 RepID=UPI0031F1CAF9